MSNILNKKPELILVILLLTGLVLIFVDATAQSNTRHEEIRLWTKDMPDGPGPQGPETISAKGSYTNIATPRLIVYRPQHPNGTAILIISGGGYAHIEAGNESTPAAEWLSANGITAFELLYRLPEEGWASTNVPFEDAQRAMRIIRSEAAKFDIDPHKIGIMGFSAGGHLAGMMETSFADSFYNPTDRVDYLSARPDFAVLLYPVITMLPPFDHTHSEKVILGKHPDRGQQKAYSVQLHVNNHTPPTFLAQAEDDPISNIANSRLMYAALQQNSIPSEFHIFPTGGHGWGMGKPGTPEVEWPELFLKWAKANNIR